MLDQVDQRVLGALRFSDRATEEWIIRPLSVSSNKARLFRKANGLYIIAEADGLKEHATSFESVPDHPPTGTIAIDVMVNDLLGNYLPRQVRVRLPRNPDPQKSSQAGSLFQAINVSLYPSVSARLSDSWSTIRASVNEIDSTSGKIIPVSGSLLRAVRKSDNEVLSSGISDPDGEALVVVPGIPIINFSHVDDKNVDPESIKTEVRLELSHRQIHPWPINPDELERDHSASIQYQDDFFLQTGKLIRANIVLQPVT